MKQIIDNFGNKILPRNKNAEVFYEYVTERYDMNDVRLAGKLYHTFRVAEACAIVGKSIGLDEILSYNIGLFHDYARFYQWEKYKTFSDNLTIDHANESVRLLFDRGEIINYDVDKKDYKLIKLAVENHNKPEINLAQISNIGEVEKKQILDYCKLIRDCDKIDIIYRLGLGDIKVNLSSEGVSPKVVERLKQHKYVLKEDTKTGLDSILTILAFLYDFNFKQSFCYINLQELFEGVLEKYGKRMSKEDQETLQECIKVIEEYLKAKQIINVNE